VKHQQTYGGRHPPLPWPERYENQQWVSFYYEPHTWYTAYVDDELINQNFDIFMTPSQVRIFFKKGRFIMILI
jgi:hypothetical protein